MSFEFLSRLQKELSITSLAVYESVLAIAERVNRKVHILRLHSQAAGLLHNIETIQEELGRQIAVAIPDKLALAHETVQAASKLDPTLTHATNRVHHLKQTLLHVDAKIRELSLEATHEDLLATQRDLTIRDAAINRFIVSPGARAAGKSISDLSLAPSVQIVTIFRGPFLIPPSKDFTFRPEDIVIIIGLQSDLEQAAGWFSKTRTAKSA
ncbi:TrkA C-terminal domain-containing protein [Petrachloros mirabilis]